MPLPAAVLALWIFRGAIATAAAASLYKAYKAQQRDYDEAYAYWERMTFEYHPAAAAHEPQYYYYEREQPQTSRHRRRAIDRERELYEDYRIEDGYQYGEQRRRRLQ